jgi:N-acetyl-anhydromuramyl-L-alanine amidase AmpD
MGRFIKVRLRSVFVVDKEGKVPRWGDSAQPHNVVGYAKVTIPKFHRFADKLTNPKTGETQININGITNPFVLRLEPPLVSLCNEPAGPLLGPPGLPKGSYESEEEKKEHELSYGVMAERRYRPLEVLIYPKKGFIDILPFPRVVDGMTHGRVIRKPSFDVNSIDIDWKPDWISVTPERKRDDEPVHPVGNKSKEVLEKASDLLAAGKWAIVIHRTTSNNIGSSLHDFIGNYKRKGAHYIIDLDGHIVKLIDDRNWMAWHAGEDAQWQGKQPVNAFSVGIEIVNATRSQYTHAQMSSLVTLIDKLRKAYKIPRERVLGHCEVRRLEEVETTPINPKEECPGFEFDWPILEKNGHATFPRFSEDLKLPPGFDEFFLNNAEDALMYPNSDKKGGRYGKKNRSLSSGRSDLVAQLQRNLVAIGYENYKEDQGIFSARTEKVLRRFQARYMTGSRESYLGEKQEHLGKATLHTVVMMQAVLAASGQEWQT